MYESETQQLIQLSDKSRWIWKCISLIFHFPTQRLNPFEHIFPLYSLSAYLWDFVVIALLNFAFHVSISFQMINLFYEMYFEGNLFSLLCWQDNTLVSPRSPLSIMPQWVNPLLIWLTLQVIYFSCRQFYISLFSFLQLSYQRSLVKIHMYDCVLKVYMQWKLFFQVSAFAASWKRENVSSVIALSSDDLKSAFFCQFLKF